MIPIAPGTFGSVEGIAIFALMWAAIPNITGTPFVIIEAGSWLLVTALNLALFAVGVWASGRVARLLVTEDPGRVVIDEVSGQVIALTPLLFGPTWPSVVLGFILFRALDILKPYPISRLERLPGGWGIMADDAGAGILAAVILTIVRLARIV